MAQPTKQDYIDRFTQGSVENTPTSNQIKEYWYENLTMPPQLQFDINAQNSTSGLSALLMYVLIPDNNYISQINFLLSLNPDYTITKNGMSINVLDTNNINHFLFIICYTDNKIKSTAQYSKISQINDTHILKFIDVCRASGIKLPGETLIQKLQNIQQIIKFKIEEFNSESMNMFSGLSMSAPPGGGAAKKKYLKYKAKYLQLKNQLN
jgi:hypothetical protein